MSENLINKKNNNPLAKQKQGGGGQQDTMSVAEAASYLLRHKWLFIISVVICCSVGVWHIWRTPKSYSRTATIMIKDEKKGLSMGETQNFKDVITIGENSVENQLGMLKSKRLMYMVAERLKLNVSYRSKNMKKTEMYKDSPLLVEYKASQDSVSFSLLAEILSKDKVRLTDKDEQKNIICKLGKSKKTPWGVLKFTLNPDANLSHIVGEQIYVSASPMPDVACGYSDAVSVALANKESSLVNLSLTDQNIKRAEDVLNTLIEVYTQDCMDDKKAVVINSANFIKARLAILEQDLDTIDSKIEEYKKVNRLTTFEAESNVYLNRSNTMDTEGLSLENQLNMVEYMRDYLRHNTDNTEMIPASIGIADGGIQQQINKYNDLLAQKIKIQSNSSDRNPLVQDINNTLLTQRGALNEALENLATSLAIQINNLRQKETENFSKITDLPTQQKELLSIQRQQKTKEQLYLYLLNKKEENELQQTIVESTCRIVDLASGSKSPVAPNKAQIMIMALLAGFIIPGVYLYLRMLFDTKVHSREDLKDITIPILGELPTEKNKSNGDIFEQDNRDHETFNETLRMVRENIDFILAKQAVKGDGRVVQLLSYMPGAGKTFVTLNLALNIAFAQKRVVVLDLDLRKVSLSRRFRIPTTKPGLSNYLAGEDLHISEITYPIQLRSGNIDIIPSGHVPPNPSELLRDPRLDELIDYLKSRYDYIICDSPPYGMLVDAFVSSRVADISLYIIRAGVFDKRLLPELQEVYDSKKLTNMSILLNGVNFKKITQKHKYAYNYRYSYNYGKTQKQTPLDRILRRKPKI